MATVAKYVAGQLIRTFQKGNQTIAIVMVSKTTHFERPRSFPPEDVRQDLADVVEENADKYSADTETVAVKY